MIDEVPLLDLTRQYRALQEELEAAVLKVCRSQRFILGEEVERFESEIARTIGAKHAIGVSSGTDALLVALMALGIGPGDEVITTPYTFFATASTISRTGAKPVFVDIEPDTFNFDLEAVERKITKKTRAIVPVHLFGRCVPFGALEQLASKTGIPLIEDAAQAIGACSGKDKRQAGTVGLMGCFSFFPSKNLGGFGDGGLLTTADDELASRLCALRVHGESSRYHHKYLGGNFRIDALQAAVLRIKLPHLPAWAEARRKNAKRYEQWFQELKKNVSSSGIITPADDFDGYHVFNQYVIRVNRRDELQKFLTDKRVSTAVYYPRPLHLQECFSDLGYRMGDFPESERAANETLALPIYPELTEPEQRHVVDMIGEFFAQSR